MKKLVVINLLLALFTINGYCAFTPQLKAKAEGGHPQSQFELAKCYLDGDGIEQSEEDAAIWFEKAAMQNHVDAMVAYANLLSNEWNVYIAPDYVKAIGWYRKAAAKGSPEAKEILATYEFSPSDITHECPFYWLPCVDDLDNFDAIKANESKIKKEFAANNPMATYYMAVLAYGNDDYSTAVKYLTDIYPVVMNDENFFEDFLEEDENQQGFSGAILAPRVFSLLGVCYEFGYGVKKDLYKAAEYYLSDFDYIAYGLSTLPKVRAAYCYLQAGDHAKFIEQANSQTVGLYSTTSSIDFHVPCLQLELAEMYKTGTGVAKDRSKALEIYENLVDKRDLLVSLIMGWYPEYRSYSDTAAAAYRASKMYLNGDGCKKDDDMAKLYFDIALRYGDNNAWYENENK